MKLPLVMSGPRITRQEIAKFQGKYSLVLPAGYAAFLCEYNGGYFQEPFSFHVNGMEVSITQFYRLFSDDGGEHFSIDMIYEQIFNGGLGMKSMLPIGESGERSILLCVKGDHSGKVFVFNMNGLGEDDEVASVLDDIANRNDGDGRELDEYMAKRHLLCPTFEAFLNALVIAVHDRNVLTHNFSSENLSVDQLNSIFSIQQVARSRILKIEAEAEASINAIVSEGRSRRKGGDGPLA